MVCSWQRVALREAGNRGVRTRWRAIIPVNEPTHLKNEMYIFMVVEQSLPEVLFSPSES